MDTTLLKTLINVSGWLPAIIIPMATLIQLWEIVHRRSAAGVSWVTWSLFGIANVGLYIYTEKYSSIQSIIGLLGSAALDGIIAGLALLNYGERSDKQKTANASTSQGQS